MAGSILEIVKPVVFWAFTVKLPKRSMAQGATSLFKNWGMVGVCIKYSPLEKRIFFLESRPNLPVLSFCRGDFLLAVHDGDENNRVY
jgi:hypothetical protein